MLAPDRYYYLQNFASAIAWVSERSGDLLDGSEHQFLIEFKQLPKFSQALLVRMILRRGPWFLENKLNYAEIPNFREAVAPLVELGWVDGKHPMTLVELFALHTKPELLQLFIRYGVNAAMRKAQMLDFLSGSQPVTQTYVSWNPESETGAWRIMIGELCERLRLMFFGNLYQSWSEFVLTELGVFQYEKVALDGVSRAFQCRNDIDCYLEMHGCREALDDGQDATILLRTLANCVSANPWLEARRNKLLFRIGQACERKQDWERAEKAYLQSRYPGSRHRRIRIFERTGRFSDAFYLAQSAQADPESDEESQQLKRMLPRLARKVEPTHVCAMDLVPATSTMRIDLELDAPGQPASVEYVLREYWHSEDTPTFYVENALMTSLFGLLCWPAIFMPLPGAFFHPFQSGPADLAAPDFVSRRDTEFNDCIAHLDGSSYCDVIRQRYTEKYGVQSPFVSWGVITDRILNLALDCIPAAHLKQIFLRMLRDIRTNRTGLPDLVRFWPAEKRYELVEVKGPGDKLQDNQIRWLQFFSEHGIPTCVCHVRWRAKNTTKPRSGRVHSARIAK
ncbi:MAG: VRR-NUC domain-containing protein [Herbaspirillum sp.]